MASSQPPSSVTNVNSNPTTLTPLSFVTNVSSNPTTVTPIEPGHSISLSNEELCNATTVVNTLNPSSDSLLQTTSGKRAWKLYELSVLIAAKRADNEKTLCAHGRDRIRTGDTRWMQIQTVLAKSGVMRTAVQSKKRWEKLMTDFKKVYDYDLNPGSGQQSYYELGSAERTAKKLPAHFAHELFQLMQPWVPEARAVNPEGNRVMDTGDLEQASREAPVSGSGPVLHDSEPLAASESEYTENISTPGNDQEVGESDPSALVDRTSSMVPPATSNFVRRKGKGKRESLDDQFKKASDQFLGFLGKDSEKRSRLEEASITWDKEKSDRLLLLDMKKHEEMMSQQEKLTNSIAGAINNMSAAFTNFAGEISKRL